MKEYYIVRAIKSDSLEKAKELFEGINHNIGDVLLEKAQLLDSLYPNGQESYLETYHEIVNAFNLNPDSLILEKIQDTGGMGGMWIYAKKLTDEFEEVHKGRAWGEHDTDHWMDAIEQFVGERI